MTAYTPAQQAIYDEKYRMLVDQGFSPEAAVVSARNRAEGIDIPPPKRNGRTRPLEHEQLAPQGETMLDLLEREMIPINHLCDPWAPEGVNLIVGRPKLGKTTLMRQKQAAIAGGLPFWGSPCTQAPCVYLSLEEGDRLTRIKTQMAAFSVESLANIEVFFEWPRGVDGVLQLQRLLDARSEVRHVGIDSLTRFRAVPDARTPAFQADYEAINGLHEITKARPGVAIDVVHHSRKMKSEDPIEDVSGTLGLSAAADSVWVLRHHEDGALLYVGGRLWDRDEHQFVLKRAQQRWELDGAYTGLSEALTSTLDALAKSGGMRPSEAAKFWGITRQGAYDRLSRLVRESKAICKDGVYYAGNVT